MARGNRDLTVNIDGDPAGFDRAMLSAKASAEVFERELKKLEYQQRLQEIGLKRAEAAVKSYGGATSAAAEKALKLGHAAEEAGTRAAESSRLAAEAAEKLSRGEIQAEEAAKLEAKALRDVERAAIANAAASRAAAEAAQKQAKEDAQASREAVVAAGAQRLAHLRTAGAVKEHNALLSKLRKDYKEFDKGFVEMKTLAGTAFTFLRNGLQGLGGIASSVAQSLGPGMVAIILAALALLPPAATLIGGALAVGIGGAFAAIGLKATIGSAVAQHALASLKDYAHSVMKDITTPFEQTWVSIAHAAKTALGKIAPDLKGLFAAVAPALSGFANQLGQKLPGALHNFFMSVKADFGPIIAELGSTLPGALAKALDGFKQIMDEIAKHPQEFGNLIEATGRLVQALGTVTVWLIQMGEAFTKVNSMVGSFGNAIQQAGTKMGPFAGLMNEVGGFVKRFDLSSSEAGNTLTNFASNLATAAAQAGNLNTETGRMIQTNKELKKTIDALLSPAIAYSEDQIAVKESTIALTAALKASHGQMGLQTQASRNATKAFDDLLTKTAQMRTDEVALYGSTKPASAAIREQVATLWRLAGNSTTAQQKVIRLAASLGVPLPASARKAKGSIDGVHQAMNGLHDKRVTITADTSAAYNAARNLQNYINSIFGHSYGGPIGYASGGMVQHFPTGGRVYGPGTETSDSIPAMLSRGEFVINAKATKEWLPILTEINRGTLGEHVSKLAAAKNDKLRAATTGAISSGHIIHAAKNNRLSAAPTTGSLGAANAILHAAAGNGGTGSGTGGVCNVLLEIRSSGQDVDNFLLERLRRSIRIRGGDVQLVLG